MGIHESVRNVGRADGQLQRAQDRKKLLELRPAVQAEKQNESDLPTGSMSPEASKAVGVHGGERPSEQARPERADSLPVGGLALTRFCGESITLTTSDGTIVISVAGIRKDRVRLTLRAPKSVSIYRTELLNKEPAA